MKRRPHRSRERPAAAPAVDITARLQRLWVACLVALLVATPLLPSEAAVPEGTGTVLVTLWVALLVAWATAKTLQRDFTLHAGPTLYAMGILLALIVTSALVAHSRGHARPMINAVWQWISFGIALLLCRELIRTAVQQRAVVAVMLACAVGQAGHGYYQSFYSMPQTRREYAADPEASLAEAGVVAPPGTPARSQFENRLNSTEPLGTFTLTNSLAGFLSPWLLIAIGTAWISWRDPRLRRQVVPGLAGCILVIAGCWLLTKSRTAWLATIFGLGLLAIYLRRSGWRPDWRFVAGLVAGPILLVLFGMIVGGLDILVLTESAKSLQYRVEYWQSTAAMIADYPWFGSGPGNFKQYYTAYKLPAASETVAEPHNFLLEVWATAGTPAALALLALLVTFAFEVRRAWPVEVAENTEAGPQNTGPQNTGAGSDSGPVYLGAAAGALIAYFPAGFLVGYMPDVALFLVGIPLAAVALLACRGWVGEGTLSLPALLCAIVLLLVNLLAAGGISFAGVSLTLWVLLALTLNAVEGDRGLSARPRPVIWGLAAAAWLLLLACHQTAYEPILRGSARQTEAEVARQRGQFDQADLALQGAAAADPYSVEPWIHLASLRHEQWMATGSAAAGEAFTDAAAQMLQRSPRSSHLQLQLGHWLVDAYRRGNRPEDLAGAGEAYRRAIALFPNHNLGHAHVAWAAFLAGQTQMARSEAELAVHLDRQNPHREQNLVNLRISDPGPGPFPQQPPPPPGNAEQTMDFLRSQLEPAGPPVGRP